MKRRVDFGEQLEKLAKNLATELASAAASEIGLGQRIDAFKALTTYWATAERVAAKTPDEPDRDGIASFSKWKEKIGGTNA